LSLTLTKTVLEPSLTNTIFNTFDSKTPSPFICHLNTILSPTDSIESHCKVKSLLKFCIIFHSNVALLTMLFNIDHFKSESVFTLFNKSQFNSYEFTILLINDH
jgi:hypothetical protein